MLQIEIISPCGQKAYVIRNSYLTSGYTPQHGVSIEVSRGQNRGEGMTVPDEKFFDLIDRFFKENF